MPDFNYFDSLFRALLTLAWQVAFELQRALFRALDFALLIFLPPTIIMPKYFKNNHNLNGN